MKTNFMTTTFAFAALRTAAASGIASNFTLVVSSSDKSINGSSLYATYNPEAEIQGVLAPVKKGGPYYFSIDETTGRLTTLSEVTYKPRFAFTLYSNFTSSLRFDIADNIGDFYFPNYTIGQDGSFKVQNLTWAWCPDQPDVGNGYYLPGSITLGPIYHGCEALDGLFVVAAS